MFHTRQLAIRGIDNEQQYRSTHVLFLDVDWPLLLGCRAHLNREMCSTIHDAALVVAAYTPDLYLKIHNYGTSL